ncbi:PAS-domain containing protein [Xanthomonas sp. NCPPB 1638]|uniref:hybrid sensor histidine kinase/response regulator n=1 Tax=Xanthomonas TaxID=338 RepID=UPI00132EB1C0|nr:PAS-domain containing protein [Xanthomonas cucurbitae]QHG88147.1 response regulator [Xanthomonas cucurbitae]WDM74712.1 PAS-domain containing protein [Xanthomonas cucurbitae]
MYASQRRRLLLTLVIVLGGMVVAMLAAGHFVQQSALREESTAVRRQLGLYAQALQQRVDRYRTLPQILALDAQLRAAVSGPLSPAQVEQLNRKLERANNVTQSSTLTLIDRNGIALAASNWRAARSNVGVDYAFRPYYQQALANGSGNFYGIGMTTSEPGYFLSQAIVDNAGQVQGVVVIKIALAALEREWLQTPDIVLASDTHDVVFLASRPHWRYRMLAPLSPRDRSELRSTRQYANQGLLPLRRRLIEQTGDGGMLVDVRDPLLEAPVLWQTLEVPESGWNLHLLHDTRTSGAAGRAAAIAAAGAWLALALLWLFVQQRRRLSALRQRSRHELEAILQQHAEELRTAQDGVVTAAQQANAGLSRSLEHLPQGVVVIDAALTLVAWNSRYVELFRFPSELLQIGRPIEDLFRYNARRGLLGPGPIEAAIERRLNHLRSGRPHMRESEKEDGTVLEIRGNPLPDGGFVTSYADITSYKNAARELRSLADALEHRVAERTRDLAAAKREAESANRYKTRFVASAVHDLLQPLNAARMFVSVLRGQLREAGSVRVVDNIDGALAAQDAILNSLLDISRLEAGSLKTQVHHFALAPLLETLAREFGILAGDRGLTLEWVATSAVVLSDETLLRRILQNFLSNAIRYTPRGRVLIGCRRHGNGVRIEVHDQGPGIPEALQHEIFEEFRRLDDGVANDRGAGLGLAIVERIGRLLGHRIGLRSTLGRGSVFSVTLPLGERAAIAQQLPPASVLAEPGNDPILHGCRVWCVDDDPRVCEATRALLERWECRVDFVGGPDDALATATAGEAPELLLLDVRMGAHYGPMLLPQLVGHWQREPRVILVTAEPSSALRDHAREAGWGFLSKPVRPPALRALVTQMLLRRG